MWNSPRIDAVLNLSVVFIGDDLGEVSITGTEQYDVSRLLLHRLEVLEDAMNRIAELQCEAAGK
jgi:hypothetical protein